MPARRVVKLDVLPDSRSFDFIGRVEVRRSARRRWLRVAARVRVRVGSAKSDRPHACLLLQAINSDLVQVLNVSNRPLPLVNTASHNVDDCGNPIEVPADALADALPLLLLCCCCCSTPLSSAQRGSCCVLTFFCTFRDALYPICDTCVWQ